MGLEHSQPRERRPRKAAEPPEVVIIKRTDPDVDLLEAYGSVEISNNVAQRLQAMEAAIQDQISSEELAKQREENARLRQQIEQLEASRKAETLSAAMTAATTAAATVMTAQETIPTDAQLAQKQRDFSETAKRVEQVFFSKHYPNACAEQEKEIIECLAKHPKQVLHCQHLLQGYKACSEQYKSKLIQDQLKQKQTQ